MLLTAGHSSKVVYWLLLMDGLSKFSSWQVHKLTLQIQHPASIHTCFCRKATFSCGPCLMGHYWRACHLLIQSHV